MYFINRIDPSNFLGKGYMSGILRHANSLDQELFLNTD